MIFDPAAEGQADPEDLRGGARAPRRFIGWQTFEALRIQLFDRDTDQVVQLLAPL